MLLGHYIKIGWRHLIKHKLFSAINILGLAVGLAATIMVALFVNDELSYDTFWSKADRIFRIHTVFTIPGRDPILSVQTPSPFIHALRKEFPQIAEVSRIFMQKPVVKKGINHFIEDIAWVDPDFIKIFDMEVIAGDISVVTTDSSSIVLNQDLAYKYFATQNPVGQVLTLVMHGVERDYKIAAVIKDFPENSQVDVNAFSLIDEKQWTGKSNIFENWFAARTQLYFTVNNPDEAARIDNRMVEVINRNFPKPPIGGNDAKASDFISLTTMPIKDLHLKSVGFGQMRERGSMERVITFSAIAILILVIACINFMNLSTARSSQRAREVSMRKVVGAKKSHLVIQFLGESILLALISLIFSLAMVELFSPMYNQLLGKNLSLNYFSSDSLVLLGLAVSVGILGGLYPAFILSNFLPARVLKANKSVEVSTSVKVRTVLVILQFSVSITLFVSTGIVYMQMLYAQNKDLGYNKDKLLMISNINESAVKSKQKTLLEELRRHSQVESITRSSETPDGKHRSNVLVRAEGAYSSDPIIIKPIFVGYHFFETYQIKLLQGRTYDKLYSDDPPTLQEVREGTTKTGKIVINNSAVKRLGFQSPEAALGKKVYRRVNLPPDQKEMVLEVIGVVEDVHFESLRSSIKPEIYPLRTDADIFKTYTIRYRGDDSAMVREVEKLWKAEIASVPFFYRFVDELTASEYQSEQGQAKIFATFSVLAVIVASLGLYGLASFSAERRTKEISIRKVMGAKVFDIVKLMLWQFSQPVLLANCLAWPLAFYSMSTWLEGFAYRISSTNIIILCIVAGFFALFIAWVTVSTIAIKVAKTNPIHTLQYE